MNLLRFSSRSSYNNPGHGDAGEIILTNIDISGRLPVVAAHRHSSKGSTSTCLVTQKDMNPEPGLQYLAAQSAGILAT